MKKIILFLLVSVLFAANSTISAATDQNSSKQDQIDYILEQLDSIILKSGNYQPQLDECYKFIKNKIDSNEIIIAYDYKEEYSLLLSTSFDIGYESEKILINISDYVLDIYDTHPTYAYASIINIFQRVYDYYINYDLFMVSLNNPIEKCYFFVDAYALEALFLKYYFEDQDSFGFLENFLVENLDIGFQGATMLFLQTDLQLLHKMDELKSEDKSSKALLKEHLKMGKQILKYLSFDDSEKWASYQSLIQLRSYYFFSTQVIFDIVQTKDNVAVEDFSIDDYPKNLEVLQDIYKAYNENIKYLDYYNETIGMIKREYGY